MARTGETCGAVTGGLMVIGLKGGYTTPDGKDATYSLAREFMRRFEEKHGTLICRDLIGCNLCTEEDLQQAKEKGVFESVCPNLVRDSIEILENLVR